MNRIGVRVPLIGRTEEFGRLQRAWELARAGTACAVLVSGDAGVGKTRLTAELIEHARADGVVLSGHCVALGQTGPPYLAFFETLDQIREYSPDLVERFDLLTSLTDAARAVGDRPHVQVQLFDAALNLLTALAQQDPVLWLVEDLHWADASTRDLLLFLLARLGRQRLLIVLTHRSDEMHRTHPLRPMLTELMRMRRVERVDVTPFDHQSVRDFVRATLQVRGEQDQQRKAHDGDPEQDQQHKPHDGDAERQDGSDEHLVEWVADRSEGNAFVAEELIDSPPGRLADPLAQVLLSRAEGLSEPARQVAQHVAVAGHYTVTHTTLALMLAEMAQTDLEQALRECVDHHVLVPAAHDAYRFRHALLGEAIYTDLLPGQRVRLHGVIAAALATQSIPRLRAVQAHHSRESNDLPGALAAHVQAAQEASAVAAPAEELTQLEHALTLWHAVPDAETVAGVDQYTVTARAVSAAAAAGRHERQLAFARTAVDLADAHGDPRRRADARWRLAKALDADYADDQETARVLTEAWDLLRHEPASPERAWVLAQLAFGCQAAERRRYAELAIADARAVGNGAAEADALVSLAFQQLSDGDHDACMAQLRSALDVAERAGARVEMLRVWFNLAITELEAGNLEAATTYLREGLDYAERAGLTWAMYGRELVSLAVSAHYMRGAWDEVAQLSAPTGEQHSDWVTAVLAATAALVHAGRGQWEEMAAALGSIGDHARGEGKPGITSALARAEHDAWRQDPAGAVRHLAEALQVLRASAQEFEEMASVRVRALAISAHADLAERARQRGDADGAREAVRAGSVHLDRVVQAMEHGRARADEPGPEARAWYARARAEATRLHGEPAADAWCEVIGAFGYGEIYQQAIARLRLAQVVLPAESGVQALTAALEVAEQLGAEPLAEAVRSLGRRHRVVLSGDRERLDLLTPRELSVLEHVARGMTNKAIGAELFISEKTVSVHVSRVMAKLGASSRTEAVTLAMQRGILPG